MTTTTDTDLLQRVLHFDALGEAEKITDSDYKTDPDTMHLGLGLMMVNNQHKRDLLRQSGDTHYGMSLPEWISILAAEGFEMLHLHGFTDDRGAMDTYALYWHPDGILVEFDTHTWLHDDGTRETTCNSGKMHYNIEFPDDPEFDRWSVTSSGHYHTASYDEGRRIWVGDHDIREGFRHNLRRLREAGRFLPQWVECDVYNLGLDRVQSRALNVLNDTDKSEKWAGYKAQDRATREFLASGKIPQAVVEALSWVPRWEVCD